MTWWQKFTSRAGKPESSEINFPVQTEPIPGKLSTRVHLSEIGSQEGTVLCWTYVTDGLRAQGQKELIFPLRRNPQENPAEFPQEPLKFFRTVYRFAEQGRLVDVGDVTGLDRSSFLGHTGVLYISPTQNENVEGLDSALTAIMLTEEELGAAMAFGPTRVMSRLGQANHYYPCPPWSDRKRPGLSFARSMKESMLAKIPRMWLRDFRVHGEQNVITFRLLRHLDEKVREQISQYPADTAMALLTNLGPSADGCLVWEPGQSKPAAITPPGSGATRLCGCFMLFVPGESEDRGMLYEDGYGMLLTDASWTIIKRGFATGQPVWIPATSQGMSFRLEWIETDYHNPLDGATFHADDGWEARLPLSSSDQSIHQDVELTRIILLQSEQKLSQRIGLEAFAAYVHAIEKVVQNQLASRASVEAHNLIAQFDLWPGGQVDIRFAIQPPSAGEAHRYLETTLAAIAAPEVTQDVIKFQIVFSIRGGSGDPDQLPN